MKILVVAAMPSELKAIKGGIKSANLKENLNIDYLCCGIGNYETISSLEHYLTENKEPTFIRNIGICGYWNLREEQKSDPIQVASIINLHTGKEMIIPPFLKIALLKTCFSGENVISEKLEIENRNGIKDDEMYFDMESRGIEFVALKYKYPSLILKVPYNSFGKSESVKEKNRMEPSGLNFETLKSLSYNVYLVKILEWINNQ